MVLKSSPNFTGFEINLLFCTGQKVGTASCQLRLHMLWVAFGGLFKPLLPFSVVHLYVKMPSVVISVLRTGYLCLCQF